MTDVRPGTIDFTVMYLTHNAFRRDLKRFKSAIASGDAHSGGVRAGWENFKTQLDVHHRAEDTALWPPVVSAATGRPDDLALMKEMEAEHAELAPRIAAVDGALSRRAADLGDRVSDLAEVFGDHLRHEEESALPLIQELLTPGDWKAWGGTAARLQGIKGAAMYVPWVLDGLKQEDRARFFAAMGRPAQIADALIFQRMYNRRRLWAR